MNIISPLILNRTGQTLWIIIISHDYEHWGTLRQSGSTHKHDESSSKSTLDMKSNLLSILRKATSVTSAGLQAVFRPKEDSARTAAAER